MKAERIDLGDGLSLGPNGYVRKKGGKKAKAKDVSKQTKLKDGNPFKDKRTVKIVPSGMPDSVVSDEGRLVPLERPDLID